MRKLYNYVGPRRIAERSASSPMGYPIGSPDDLRLWVQSTEHPLDYQNEVSLTFVVDETGVLRIADRRSEHVACAGGRPVQSAGEMAFEISDTDVNVAWVTNQSTGYCPEPESWPAVEAALNRAGVVAPAGFSTEFAFRRCGICGTTNIVKDGVFECAVCGAELPLEWNLAPSVPNILNVEWCGRIITLDELLALHLEKSRITSNEVFESIWKGCYDNPVAQGEFIDALRKHPNSRMQQMATDLEEFSQKYAIDKPLIRGQQ